MTTIVSRFVKNSLVKKPIPHPHTFPIKTPYLHLLSLFLRDILQQFINVHSQTSLKFLRLFGHSDSDVKFVLNGGTQFGINNGQFFLDGLIDDVLLDELLKDLSDLGLGESSGLIESGLGVLVCFGGEGLF